MSNVIGNIDSSLLPRRTGGKIVVADQIYRGRFCFASKNCENKKNTGFATLFLVLQQRKDKRKKADVNVIKRLTKTTITCRNQEISSQEFFAETWPKMTFLAKCVFLMANNLEQERNIDGICSTCVCCPEQSINIWFLSDTVRQRSSVCEVFC